MITADRPAMAGRSLRALIRHADRFGHQPRLVVVDGSRRRDDRAQTRALLVRAGRKTGWPARYVGRDEAAALADAVEMPRSLRDAIMPGAIGASRNLFLLLTAGERVLSIDDDVLAETWSRRDTSDKLVVAGHDDVRHTDHFTSRARARDAAGSAAHDLLHAHALLLGQTLQTLIDRSRPAADVSRACEHLQTAIDQRHPRVVTTTSAGLAGDSAVYCPYRLLFASNVTRTRLWSSQQAFRTAMTRREVTRIAPAFVVTHDSNCMAYCLGLANDRLLPPFMPLGRNEDGVFGLMLAASDPSAVFGHLPVGIVHGSIRPSRYERGEMRSAEESRLSELLIGLVRQWARSASAGSPETRLVALGGWLRSLGRMKRSDVVDLVVATTAATRAADFRNAALAADDPACPDYWRQALAEYRTRFLAAVRRPRFFLPVEFHRQPSIGAGYHALRAFLTTFGSLVEAWPALRRAAELRLASAR